MNQVPQAVLNAYARDAAYPQNHMDAIIDFARGVNPKVILDVGTHYGSSAIHLQNAFPEAMVITVGDEIPRGGWIPGDFENANVRFEACGMQEQIIAINCDTMFMTPRLEQALAPQAIARAMQGRLPDLSGEFGIGFVFLDASHNFDGLRAEYGQYKQFLSPRHRLVLDDTTEDGVCRFSMSMVEQGYQLQVGSTFKGLAVLDRG